MKYTMDYYNVNKETSIISMDMISATVDQL